MRRCLRARPPSARSGDSGPLSCAPTSSSHLAAIFQAKTSALEQTISGYRLLLHLSSSIFINILQFFNYYRFSILGESNALRSMSPCLYYHSWAIHFSGLGIDPRTMQSISYLIIVSYASTSLPSFCNSSVALITISKSSSRSPAASSGYASPRLL